MRGKVSRRDRIIATVGEYALEISFMCWGITTGLATLFGSRVGRSIEDLPTLLRVAWSILMLIAALTVLFGLFFRQYASTVGRGITLFGSILAVYAIAIVATTGFGAASGLLAVLGGVCLVRGAWLKRRDRELVEEMTHPHHPSAGDDE